MKRTVFLTVAALLILSAAGLRAEEPEQYVARAEKLRESGNLDGAVSLLSEGAEKFPENSTLLSYLGLYTGMSAGQTTDFAEAGRLANESFRLLDRAVSLDGDNPEALMNRGIIFVNVPEFLGKLDTGIEDLEKAVEILTENPDIFSTERKIAAREQLGTAYERKEEYGNAVSAWEGIIALTPGSKEAERAEEKIRELREMAGKRKVIADEAREVGSSGITSRGINAYTMGEFSRARELLSEAVETDPDNFEANKYLGLAYARLAEVGYDERIAGDTNLRTNLVMKSVKYLDRAVDLRPDDPELRFTRGGLLVYFPFFTGKLDQGLADLEMVLQSSLSDSLKAETCYLLGIGYRKKGNHFWTEGTVKYPDSEASARIYREMIPDLPITAREEQGRGTVRINLLLGYRDELPPQTAVWIEDSEGDFVRTLYVSGFSGHVLDRQIVLPEWAETSEFSGVDAVTGASIDVGFHSYTWDLKDSGGRRVRKGRYTVKAEVSHWPSYKYQIVEAGIRVNGKADRTVVEEGNFIPRLEVNYLPE